MNQLDILVQNRDAILIAEAVGWLHDYRKCSEEQLRVHAANMNGQQGLRADMLSEKFPALSKKIVSLFGETCTCVDLLNRKAGSSFGLLVDYLSRCHDSAHFDKQEPVKGKGSQNYPGVQVSSPFGFERDVPDSLTDRLWNDVPWRSLADLSLDDRMKLIQDIGVLFTQVGADTRRPINEVSLWDWGMLVGALYKTAIAGRLLSKEAQPASDLRWRLLSVRVDGLSYIANVERLSDILCRRMLLADGFDKVRRLLEETYPIGNEIYRDENGSVYVVANLPDILNFTNGNGEELCQLILKEFKQGTLKNDAAIQLGGEITPAIDLEGKAWWGKDPDPDWREKKRLGQPLENERPLIDELLMKTIFAYPNPTYVQSYWHEKYGEICTVCLLRPQGPSQKARERKVCDICEERRADRSLEWATSKTQETIWIDEVSDTNGRVALISGQFEMTHWLDGQLVESLLLIAPGSDATPEVKTSSFSRIRRVWETTRKFWKDVLPTDEEKDVSDALVGKIVGQAGRRLCIKGLLTPATDNKCDGTLGPYHVYELKLNRVNLSVLWDSDKKYFITCDNLDYLAKPEQLGQPVKEWLKQQNGPLTIKEPTGYGSTNKIWGTLTIQDDGDLEEIEHSSYTPAIPILSEPRTFMALVPADRAMEIIQEIKTKYEREMGKVRNRLPIHLGVVYAHRRTPLRAILDAGRRMLKQKPLNSERTWTVLEDASSVSLPAGKEILCTGTQQFNTTIQVKIQQDSRCLTWLVPAVMGDGKTQDDWYPYVFLETNGDYSKINGRIRAFKGKRPADSGSKDCWLVHAGELRGGDQVYFTPATFDWEWLDSSARRFEIAYDEQGKRYSSLSRPYLLDELDNIQKAWELLRERTGLTTSQIHALRDVIETRREAWQAVPNDETFRNLCRQAILNADWKEKPAEDIDRLSEWAADGILKDAIELYMGIMKERPKRNKTSEE